MICIVGGSGFIGSRLCKRLEVAGKEFYIVDKNGSAAFPELVTSADVRSEIELSKAIRAKSVLVNLAAEHRDDVRPKSLYDEVNVNGAENLCKIARERGIDRIIFTSSVAVYGFAPANTDEAGKIDYFNDYGRTKWLAENVFRAWQEEDPVKRTLVIVRPTVVFGEQNRGNVYNLLRQIASGRFIMIGRGKNRKSMAYVENVAAFIEYTLSFKPGVHTYNYVDKPDLEVQELVKEVRTKLGRGASPGYRIPYVMGLLGGHVFDIAARLTRKSLPISSIRVKKFCATTQFGTSVATTGFVPPVSLKDGLGRTVQHEFLEQHNNERVFYTE